MTNVQLSAAAMRDLENATIHYLDVAGLKVAAGFNDAWLDAQTLLEEHPLSGSTSFGAALGDKDVRALPFRGYPYLAFYRVTVNSVLILRVLHTSRDIPASLRS